tara:strand:- start:1140 stop:2720 length:1581 start_codon:yes stop_codon:yes gene_type:complete
MKISKDFFKDHAHQSYLAGLDATGITIDRIPKISDMDKKLKKIGWRAVPVRGFLPPTIFMQFQAHSILPIACDMRTVNHITYTPAPDIVHEAAGHSPIIVNESYSNYLKNYGQAASKAISSTEDHAIYMAIRLLSDIKENPQSKKEDILFAEKSLEKALQNNEYLSEAAYLSRLNWWTVEYGLIGDIDKPKIFGAGLLSSVGESYNAIYGDVKVIPLTLDCINYSYDITEQQPQLFIANNFNHLNDVLNEYKAQMAYKIGGIKSIRKGIESKSVCTLKLNTGLEISGIPTDVYGHTFEEFYRFEGPVQLCYQNKELKGHGGEYHKQGFSSPICTPSIINQLQNTPINEAVNIKFKSGINLNGIINNKLIADSKLLVASFTDCKITDGDKLLFDPSWGTFDLACGTSIISVYGGPADIKCYLKFMNLELPNKIKPNYLTQYSNKEKVLINLYDKISNKLNNDELELIIHELDFKFQKDWLLRFELLSLLDPIEHSKLIDKIKIQIHEISKDNHDLNNSIERGLNIIY